MHGASTLLALAGSVTSALAAVQGFNYGSTFTTGAAKQQSDFESEFKTAQALYGAPGTFNSARLYTMIQGGTQNDVISAIPAAISTKTTLLLGLWGSAGDAVFANELQALKTAVSQYGSSFASSVIGISVGSEDLYRETPTGLKSSSGNPGASPATITSYIIQVKDVLKSAGISVPVGHVDTWNAWVNSTVTPVIEACDFIGIDTYPYFQNTQDNDIDNAKGLFDQAVDATRAVIGGKPIWITETGWPVSGETQNLAVASTKNAKAFWDTVGCGELFGKTNTWWYTLQDALPATPNPSFGLLSGSSTTPLYDLSCPKVTTTSSSSAAASSTASSAASSSAAAGSSITASAAASKSSAAASSLSAGGGSPALSSGLPSSQLSLESQTSTATSTASAAAATGSSGSSTGTGSGSSSGSGSNSTVSTVASATPTPSVPTASSGSSNAVSLGAGLLAVFAVMLSL